MFIIDYYDYYDYHYCYMQAERMADVKLFTLCVALLEMGLLFVC